MSRRKTAEEKEKEEQEKAAEDKKKEEQAKTAEDKKKESKTPEEPNAAPENGQEMVRVRVKKEIVKNGGGFYDFHSGVDMYPKSHQKIFTVPMTPFIGQKVRTGELILVAKKT